METEQVIQTPPAESSPAAHDAPVTEPKTPPAESSPAAEAGEDFEAADFETMTDAQRSEWLETGKTPTKQAKAKEPAAEGKPAEGAKPDQKPESGPGKKLPGNPGEQVRVHQLLQERHQNRTRIQELEAQLAGKAPKADSQPAPGKTATPPAPAKLEAPVAPKLDDFQTWGEYMEAQNAYVDKLTDYKADLRDQRRQQEAQAATARQQNETLAKTWNQKVTAATAKHADFEAVALSPALGAIIPEGSVIDAFILESPHGAELLYHLGSDLAEAERMAGLTPIQQARELAKLESRFEVAPPAPGNEPKAETPPVRRVSQASPPARELDRPGSVQKDPIEAALDGKDFETYMAEQNAREIKARRGK
jgi:hypothetical protein